MDIFISEYKGKENWWGKQIYMLENKEKK
jgi:hypothetical protein